MTHFTQSLRGARVRLFQIDTKPRTDIQWMENSKAQTLLGNLRKSCFFSNLIRKNRYRRFDRNLSIVWFILRCRDSFLQLLVWKNTLLSILFYLPETHHDSFQDIYNWNRHRWHRHRTFQFTLRKLSTLLWRWCTVEAHLKQRRVNYSDETAVIDSTF